MTKTRSNGLVMARAALFALGLVALLGAAGRAADDDPVKEKLDKAKAAYDQQIDKAKAALVKSLDAKEEAARKAGNVKLVDQIKTEREAFETKGELPKTVSTANFTRDRKLAGNALELAYGTAVKEYLKGKKDDEAAALTKDLEEFKNGNAGPSLATLLTKDSVWDGERRFTLGKGGTNESPFQLKVTLRDGKDFKGEIVFGKKDKYDVVGTVTDNAISFSTDKNEKIKHTYEGRLRGGVLDLAFEGNGLGAGGAGGGPGLPIKGIVRLLPPKGK